MFESMKSGVAVSADEDLEDELLWADLASETYTGATNAATALGNGRLTVGISPWAEVTYFRWPRASFYDHLRYFTFANPQSFKALLSSAFKRPKPVRMSKDAPSQDFRRHGRPYEPHPELGSQAGVLIDSESVSWLGEPTWTAERSYVSETSPILETRLEHELTKLKVRDWVDSEKDLMVRKFTIGKDSERFFYHNTFQPLTTHPSTRSILYPLLPDPSDAGFAAVYHPEEDLITHFKPNNPRDDEQVRATLKNGCSPETLDKLFPGRGIFVTWGFKKESDGHQVGADRAGKKVDEDAPIGGREDAKDGKLEGNNSFIGPVDSSFSKNLSSGESEVTVLISAANRAKKAADIVKNGREVKMSTLNERLRRGWRDIVNEIYIPDDADEITSRVIRRSIMNLFIGRDERSGAIIASPAQQPAYHFDWPRDGAFFDLALDLAGFPDVVEDHLEFYSKTQRSGSFDFNPSWILGLRFPVYKSEGHWYSNMTSDGEPGYIRTIPFEIDETALLIWDIWRHDKFLSNPERQIFRNRYRPVLERAADALVRHVDADSGRVRKTFEDDGWKPKSTLHGATSVLTGLCSAIDAGERWGSRGVKILQWGKAAKSLRRNTLEKIETGKVFDNTGWRGLSWAVWPAPLFKFPNDYRAGELVDRLFNEVKEKIEGERLGCAYLGEQIWELALALRDKASERREFLKEALKEFTHEVPFPGTDCYGEVALRGDFAGTGKPVYQNRTSIPHLWNGVTAYLAALAFYEPEKFEGLRPPRPEEIRA